MATRPIVVLPLPAFASQSQDFTAFDLEGHIIDSTDVIFIFGKELVNKSGLYREIFLQVLNFNQVVIIILRAEIFIGHFATSSVGSVFSG